MKPRGIAAGLILFGALVVPAVQAGVMQSDGATTVRPDPIYRSATLRSGFAEVLNLNYPIDTVIVGDVSVLNATVLDGNSVVLTALSAGRTNVIILDAAGDPLGRLSVRVREGPANLTRVYRGASVVLLRCDPACHPLSADAAGMAE